MGRGQVRDFRTIQTTSVKIPYKPPAHEVIYLFHTYWVNISSFYLGKLLFSWKKMTSEFKKHGPAQTKLPKKYIIRWALQCCELKYWQKIDQKWNTIYWINTLYDDNIIKWPLKHRIVLLIKNIWQTIVTEMVQQAGCPHRMSRELAWCVSSSALQ